MAEAKSYVMPVEKRFAILCQIARAQHFSWYEAIKAMCLSNRLDHVGNQLSGWQRVVHATMPHGDTVTDTRDTKNKRMPTTGMDAFFDESFQVTHTCMARD